MTTWEPARHLSAAGNVHFKAYVHDHDLGSLVRMQVRRERAAPHPDDDA